MGKECCANVSSRLWGGALRDETKNGCEGDYMSPGFRSFFVITVLIIQLVTLFHAQNVAFAAKEDIK